MSSTSAFQDVLSTEIRLPRLRRRVLIIGSGPLARDLCQVLLSRRDCDFEVVGNDLPKYFVNGSLRHFGEVLAERKIGCVVVALSERRGVFPTELLLSCRANGIRVVDGVSFYEKLSGKIPLSGLNPSSLIFSDGFNRLTLTVFSKRVLDVLVSVVGLLVAIPFWILIPIVIKLDSEGPVLFRQERIGQDGKPFRFLKFRTMRWKVQEGGDSRWTKEQDARLTRAGRAIRQWRLDELPQLWNVVRGDLSFVGPRPDVPSLLDTLQKAVPYYSLRMAVKPGITGWAQVRYRYVSSMREGIERHEYDLYYIKNMSLLLDLKIILETFKIVLLGNGAH